MPPAGALAWAFVLSWALGPRQAGPASWSSLEREAQVRTWAHDPAGHRAELLSAVDGHGQDWTRRAAAFEALRRAVEVGTLGARDALVAELAPSLRAAAADAGERALAQALELAAVWPGELALTGGEFASAAAHPHPAVRLALVRCAERHPAAGALLAALARDDDARVALEARRTWVASPALRAALVESAGAPGHAAAAEGGAPGLGPASGLSPEALERANVPAELLSPSAPLGLALGLRLHGAPAAVRPLAAAWERVEEPAERALLLRAARSARARELPLEAALRARLGEVQGEPRLWLLEGLVAAGRPAELVPELDPEAAAIVLGLLVGREVDWDFERMRRFVDPRQTERELRRRALMTFASAPPSPPAPDGGPHAAERLLALGLEDPDPLLVEVGFRALTATRDPARWMEALHAAWLRQDDEGRARFLRYLPREVAPGAFRADLLELAGDERRSPAVRASALELLAGCAGDEQLARTVDAWLEQELERLRTAPEGSAAGARRLAELRCTGLVRALQRLRGEGAVPRLVDTLALAADPARPLPGGAGEDIGKVTVTALAASPDGRAALERWLAGAGTERARIEAGIQLAPLGSALAVEVLAQAYPDCDWELGTRILKSLQRLDDAASSAFLERVAADPREAVELRHLALAGLALRGRDSATEVLCAVFERSDDLELRRSAAGLLGLLGGARAREFLRERLASLEALPLETGEDGLTERARSEREALITALGRAGLADGRMPAELLRAWLRLPGAAAADELAARFVGRQLATTSFRYGAELELGELLALAGRAEEALAAGGAWWTCDARFLAALGARLEAGGDPASARAAWRAALVGLAGEGDAPDRPALELDLRCHLMASAEGAGDWEQLARLVELVLRDWRLLRTPALAFAAQFGEFQPERGLDPERRLECAVHQARARAALAGGDASAARGHAARAAAGLGFSQTAREAQERLERELATAGR